MILWGGDHNTKDVDVAVLRTRDNAKRIAAALAPFRPRPSGWPDDLPFVWDDQTIMNSSLLTLETTIGRIDFAR